MTFSVLPEAGELKSIITKPSRHLDKFGNAVPKNKLLKIHQYLRQATEPV